MWSSAVGVLLILFDLVRRNGNGRKWQAATRTARCQTEMDGIDIILPRKEC